jgi:hypothetical protein
MDIYKLIDAVGQPLTAKLRGRINMGLHFVVLAFGVACLLPVQAVSDLQSQPGTVGQSYGLRHPHGNSLEDRVRVLSKALDLDATQQSALRKVLEGQRDQVRRVWDDSSVPAVYRVSATQGISDKTGDQIRALLNVEQRKKYNAPRVPHEAMEGSAPRSVESWMDSAQPK